MRKEQKPEVAKNTKAEPKPKPEAEPETETVEDATNEIPGLLAGCSDEQLFEELRRRGYSGPLKQVITREIMI